MGLRRWKRLTEVFDRQVHRDPLLAPVFAHVGADHAHHVAVWLGEVFGGPATYTTDHGGYPTMLATISVLPSPRSSGRAGRS